MIKFQLQGHAIFYLLMLFHNINKTLFYNDSTHGQVPKI